MQQALMQQRLRKQQTKLLRAQETVMVMIMPETVMEQYSMSFLVSDDCIPSPPPDLDRGDDGVPENFEVLPPDPHNFDPDNDGIGCESESNQQSDLNEEPRSPGSGDSLTLGDLISRAIDQLNSGPL